MDGHECSCGADRREQRKGKKRPRISFLRLSEKLKSTLDAGCLEMRLASIDAAATGNIDEGRFIGIASQMTTAIEQFLKDFHASQSRLRFPQVP